MWVGVKLNGEKVELPKNCDCPDSIHLGNHEWHIILSYDKDIAKIQARLKKLEGIENSETAYLLQHYCVDGIAQCDRKLKFFYKYGIDGIEYETEQTA